MQTAEQSKQTSIIRKRELIAITGLSASTLYRLELCGSLPKRRRLSSNSVGWDRNEIQSWLNSRDVITREVNN